MSRDDELRELYSIDARWVSLVRDPSIGESFKAIRQKTEETMNSRLQRFLRSRTSPVRARAVIARSEAAATSAARALFDTEEVTVTEYEGHFLSRRSDAEGDPVREGDVALTYPDGSVVVVENVQRQFTPMENLSTEFADVMKAEGFTASLSMTLGMLGETLTNILMSEDINSVDAQAAAISRAFEEAGRYAASLAAELPENVVRYDAQVTRTLLHFQPSDDAPATDTGEVPADAAPAPTTQEGEEAPAEPASAPGSAEAGAPGSSAPATEATPDAPAPAGSGDGGLPAGESETTSEDETAVIVRQTAESVSALAETLAEIKRSIEAVDARVGSVEGRVQESDDALARVQRAMGTTVVGMPEQDGPGQKPQGQKARRSAPPPLLDTAFAAG